ncbi:MAG: hypothetical protein IKR86_05365 [Candidatus Methanomethylophilaceae archaeon]|nr:hypothetical protein [Candidatus Methanomethylophilaceae archaeon]
MMKGSLVKIAFLLAIALMIMSFAIVAFPNSMDVLAPLSAAIAVAVIAVLVLMFFRMRKV